MTAELPYRGLGLSSNLDVSDVPHPYRLKDAHPELFDFVEYSAPLSLDEARAQASLFDEMWRRRSEVPVLFHPVHFNLYGPELEAAAALRALDEHARAVGSAWVGNDVAWWHHAGEPFPGYLYLPPPLTAPGLDDCVAHALHAQEHLSVPLLLENPAVTASRGGMHVLDFMAALHQRTGLGLILDLGHLLSHQLMRGLPLSAALDGFPFEQVFEIHLAGGVVTTRGDRRFYVDDHTQPVREELFELLSAVLPRCERLRALTFEGDGHPASIAVHTLRRLRADVPSRREPSHSPLSEPQRAPAFQATTRPWELFAQAHGAGESRGEDPVGEAAELDYRLAVIAEQLEAAWPLSRLLVAGTRDALAAFAASAEYRAAFRGEAEGRGLVHAFGAYARREVRERRDEGAAAALAFETWALAALARNRWTAPAPGRVGLSRGVKLAAFPVNLEELWFAARALSRHLSRRAAATGTYEASALEALSSIARRAPPGPWEIALARRRLRLEVTSLTAGLAAALRAASDGPAEAAFLAGGPGFTSDDAEAAIRLGLVATGQG